MHKIPTEARHARSATYRFGVASHPQTFGTYLVWEYGKAHCGKAPEAFGPVAFFKTRREAVRFCERVRAAQVAVDGQPGDKMTFVI